MNYINGLLVGAPGEGSVSPYAFGAAQFRHLVYVFLTKVVGWADKDKSGTRWNNPIISQKTDGATDASDPTKFTSATATFTNAAAGDVLVVTSGFPDTTLHGFYPIRQIAGATTIYVDIWNGVHTSGLPLGVTGVTFEVHRFHGGAAYNPQAGDWFVATGTGDGGNTFDLRCVCDSSVSYFPERWDISPYADWNAGTHAWSTTPSRYTAQTQIASASNADYGWVWGFADMAHAVFWVKYYISTTGTVGYPWVFYFGDIDPFHASSDTRPVIQIVGQTDSYWSELTLTGGIYMVAGDNTQSTGRYVFASESAASNVGVPDTTLRNRSQFSRRLERFPLIIASEVAGKEEIRGTLRGIYHTHYYGARQGSPVGATRGYLRFTYWAMNWNGSKQYRYLY